MKRRIQYRHSVETAITYAVSLGYSMKDAATHGGIHRATLYRWLSTKPEFARRFAEAWEAGAERRDFRKWLHHPFRGYRPPTACRTRDFPRYGIRRK